MYTNSDNQTFKIGSRISWLNFYFDENGDKIPCGVSRGIISGDIFDNLALVKKDGLGEFVINLEEATLLE
jgi:hypothetical protein